MVKRRLGIHLNKPYYFMLVHYYVYGSSVLLQSVFYLQFVTLKQTNVYELPLP